MKKLYDETYEHSRTIWYLSDGHDDVIETIFGAPSEYGGRMIVPTDYTPMISRLRELIMSDLAKVPEPKPTATQWVFYSNLVSDDAIGDKVRFSIYIRLKEGKYDCNINITDFLFATSFDEVIKIKNLIEQNLNSDNHY
jgi:hypothetical protein